MLRSRRCEVRLTVAEARRLDELALELSVSRGDVLRGALGVDARRPPAAEPALARMELDEALGLLEGLARGGDREATLLLVRTLTRLRPRSEPESEPEEPDALGELLRLPPHG